MLSENKYFDKLDNKMRAVVPTVKEYLLRDKILLKDISSKTTEGCVNLHRWIMPYGKENIGDYLSYIVVEWMKNYYDITADLSKQNNTCHLYGIGSIINSGYQDATVWGSGLLENKKFWWRKFRELDIRCVRGPMTRNVLIKNGYKCPEIYGDPAVLMPFIYQPNYKDKIYDYTIIPHHSFINKNNKNILSPITTEYKNFIDKIVQSRLIISSSLHGIVLAEVYGVPAILLKSRQNLFKYKDWYYSTNRFNFPIVNSIEEALKIKPIEIPNFYEMQKNIIRAFPFDLYK